MTDTRDRDEELDDATPEGDGLPIPAPAVPPGADDVQDDATEEVQTAPHSEDDDSDEDDEDDDSDEDDSDEDEDEDDSEEAAADDDGTADERPAEADEPAAAAPEAARETEGADVAAEAEATPAAEGQHAPELGLPPVPFVVEDWMLAAVEAIVFSSPEPVPAARVREILVAEMAAMDGMEGKTEPGLGDVRALFRTLVERWSDPTRTVAHGFRLVELDGGLSFRTAAAQARFIRRMQLGKPQRLSRATLETLAVVAYRQPVTKPQIEEVRGVDSSGAVKALLDKKLIRVLGKAEDVGRPLLYGTTKTFLEFFEMQSLTDLPSLKELHELEHGVADPAPVEGDDRPAVIMDLFNADTAHAVSEETERESNDALDALERALGEAKDVAKRASTLVFGMKVEDGADGDAPRAVAPVDGGDVPDASEPTAVATVPSDEDSKA